MIVQIRTRNEVQLRNKYTVRNLWNPVPSGSNLQGLRTCPPRHCLYGASQRKGLASQQHAEVGLETLSSADTVLPRGAAHMHRRPVENQTITLPDAAC